MERCEKCGASGLGAPLCVVCETEMKWALEHPGEEPAPFEPWAPAKEEDMGEESEWEFKTSSGATIEVGEASDGSGRAEMIVGYVGDENAIDVFLTVEEIDRLVALLTRAAGLMRR